MQLGKKRLIFAETKMNRTSSRFASRMHNGFLIMIISSYIDVFVC